MWTQWHRWHGVPVDPWCSRWSVLARQGVVAALGTDKADFTFGVGISESWQADRILQLFVAILGAMKASPSSLTIRRNAAALLVLAAVSAGACSSDSASSAGTTASSATTSATTATTAQTTTAPTTTAPTTLAATPGPCDGEPVVLTTSDGVDFVRTPDSCFENLEDWPYEPKYVEIDGLRQAYIDEGPADGEVILLLHGQPSWSYLYHRMIPTLVEGGYRVVAMDHLGMGRSDKPVDLASYSFDGHVDRLVQFVNGLELNGANLFAQDWGSVIGLWAAADNPDMFSRYIIGNGGVPNVYKGFDVPTELTEASKGFGAQIDMIPEQQPPFFDAEGKPLLGVSEGGEPGDISGFATWAGFAMYSEEFSPSKFVEALTYIALSDGEERAYGAPFPSRDYMGGPRAFPTLLNQLLGRTDAQKAKLTQITAPLLTIFGGNDPGLVGEGDGQPFLTNEMPGAANQPHHRYPDASHFLQNDQGPDIAARTIAFIEANAL
jgi:haloalkane dehalogenase